MFDSKLQNIPKRTRRIQHLISSARWPDWTREELTSLIRKYGCKKSSIQADT